MTQLPTYPSHWFQHHPLILLPINFNNNGFLKADVADIFILEKCRLASKEIEVVGAVVNTRIDGKIPDTEGCEVLEEMCSLAWIDAVVVDTRLNDDAGS